LKNIRIGIKCLKGNIRYVAVWETPHYEFVKSYINNSPENEACGYKSYNHYNEIAKHPTTDNRFKMIADSIFTEGYVHERGLIQVTRSIRRPMPWNRFDVTDGAHRVAILSAIGLEKIRVEFKMETDNLFKMFINKIRAL